MPKYSDSYQHYFADVALDPNYPGSYRRQLIMTGDELDRVLDLFAKSEKLEIAFDTETMGLNPEEDKIVGVSFCYEPFVGYYVPLRHVVGKNIEMDPDEALRRVYGAISRARIVFLYNARFDLRFLKYGGFVSAFSDIRYLDVAAVVFLADTNVPFPSLKGSARKFLGWQMQTFHEVTSGGAEAQLIPPSQLCSYAADDALATFNLAHRLSFVVKEAAFIVKVDNEVLKAVDFLEEIPIQVSVDVLKSISEEVEREIGRISKEIFEEVRVRFDINSPKQLVEVLRNAGVNTGRTTKTGQMGTGAKALEAVADAYPVVKKILRYRRMCKLKSTYVDALLGAYRPDLGGARFEYHTTATPTGRFSSGGGDEEAE